MTDILNDIAAKLDGVRVYDTYLASLCPFHTENRPSFIVHERFYECLSCNAKGTTKSLLKHLSGEPDKVSIHSDFRNPFTKWLKSQSLGEILKTAWQNNKRRPSIYLKNRGIPDKKQIELGLGLLDDWITFPIRNNEGKITGAVARVNEGNLSPSKYVVPAGQDPNLIYVPDWKIKSRYVYCCFGIIDAISMCLNNVFTFSTTSGKRLGDISVLDSFRTRIIFLPDRGEEGEAIKIAAQLGWRGHCPKMHWPDDAKDVNDVFIRYPEMIVKAVQDNESKLAREFGNSGRTTT